MYPRILHFLGYEPWKKRTTLEDQLQVERRRRGLSAKATARLLNVDEGTYARWERGRWPQDRHWPIVVGFLKIIRNLSDEIDELEIPRVSRVA